MGWMSADDFFGVARFREASARVEAPADGWYQVQVLGSGARLLWVGHWQRRERGHPAPAGRRDASADVRAGSTQ